MPTVSRDDDCMHYCLKYLLLRKQKIAIIHRSEKFYQEKKTGATKIWIFSFIYHIFIVQQHSLPADFNNVYILPTRLLMQLKETFSPSARLLFLISTTFTFYQPGCSSSQRRLFLPLQHFFLSMRTSSACMPWHNLHTLWYHKGGRVDMSLHVTKISNTKRRAQSF